MPRMSILEGEEKMEFDSPPLFNSAERKRFSRHRRKCRAFWIRLGLLRTRCGFC